MHAKSFELIVGFKIRIMKIHLDSQGLKAFFLTTQKLRKSKKKRNLKVAKCTSSCLCAKLEMTKTQTGRTNYLFYVSFAPDRHTVVHRGLDVIRRGTNNSNIFQFLKSGILHDNHIIMWLKKNCPGIHFFLPRFILCS